MKLIVTSATLNAKLFSDYFGGVPTFYIPGRTFHVEKLHAKNPQEDYVEAAINQVLEIHMTYPPGDILVFMTGQEDIETTCEVLVDRCNQLAEKNPQGMHWDEEIDITVILPSCRNRITRAFRVSIAN